MFKKTILLSFMALMACSQLALAQNLPEGVHELPLALPPIPFDENLKKLGVNLFNCGFIENTISLQTASLTNHIQNPLTFACNLYHEQETEQDPIPDTQLAKVFVPLKADGTYGQPQTFFTPDEEHRRYLFVRSFSNGTALLHKSVENYERQGRQTVGNTTYLTGEYLHPNVSTLLLLDQQAQQVWKYEFAYDLGKDPRKESKFYNIPDAEAIGDGYAVVHYAPEWSQAADYYHDYSERRGFGSGHQYANDAPTVPVILDRFNAQGYPFKNQRIDMPILAGTRDAYPYHRLHLWPLGKDGYAISVYSVSVNRDSPFDSSFAILFLNADDTVNHLTHINLATAHLEKYATQQRRQKMLIDAQGQVLLQTYDDTNGKEGAFNPEVTLYDTNGHMLWHQFITLDEQQASFKVYSIVEEILETPQQQYLVIVRQGRYTDRREGSDRLFGILFNQKGEEVWRLPLLNGEQLQMADPDIPLAFTFLNRQLWIKLEGRNPILSGTDWQKALASKGLLSENLGLHVYSVDLPK